MMERENSNTNHMNGTLEDIPMEHNAMPARRLQLHDFLGIISALKGMLNVTYLLLTNEYLLFVLFTKIDFNVDAIFSLFLLQMKP